MEDAHAKIFGKYILLDELGRGGEGRVDLGYAEDPTGEPRPFAIKRALSLNGQQNLRVEASMLAKLVHPRIEAFIEAGVIEGQVYLAKEFIDGITLHEFRCDLRRSQVALPLPVACQIAALIGEGLSFLHGFRDPQLGGSVQILHGDLKPSNIMLTWNGQIKLIDLGIARFARREYSASEPVRWVSPRYASPDRILNSRLSIQDDLFALGIIFWELVCGESYWGEHSSDEIVATIESFKARDPRALRPEVPESLAKCILRCFSSESFEGYFEVRDFLETLAEVVLPAGQSSLSLCDCLQKFCQDAAARREALVMRHRSEYQSLRQSVPSPSAQSDPLRASMERKKFRPLQAVAFLRAKTAIFLGLGKALAGLFVVEVLMFAGSCIWMPGVPALVASSGAMRTLQYLNHVALAELYDLSGANSGLPKRELASLIHEIRIESLPEAETVLLEGEVLLGSTKSTVPNYFNHLAWLTLQRRGFADLHVLVQPQTRLVKADFAKRTVSIEN